MQPSRPADPSAEGRRPHGLKPDVGGSPPARVGAGSTLGIVGCTASAAGLLAALHAQCFEDGWSDRFIASILHLPGSAAFLAQRDEAPVGLAVMRAACDEAELLTIGVMAEARGGGVGAALVAAILARAAQMNVATVFLDVAVSNTAARALYARAGFIEVGRRPDYYRTGDDALALARHL